MFDRVSVQKNFRTAFDSHLQKHTCVKSAGPYNGDLPVPKMGAVLLTRYDFWL